MTPQMRRLLDRLAQRKSFVGVALASHYAEPLRPCLSDEACSVALYESGDPAAWERALKTAGETATFCADDAVILGRSWAPGKKVAELPTPAAPLAGAATPTELVQTPGAVMDLECVVTSTRQDRQGDVLEVDGAELDPLAPLLMFHLPTMPAGKLVRETFRGDAGGTKIIKAHCAIVDTEIGNDAATLVEFGALRISHGFNPIDLDEIESAETGMVSFHIRRYKILEISLVTVPANEDAVITASSRGKLHHPIVKAWAARLRKSLPAQSTSGFELPSALTSGAAMHKCGCNGSAKDAAPAQSPTAPSAPPAVAPAVPSGAAQACPNKPEVQLMDGGKCPMAEESRGEGLTACKSCSKPLAVAPGAAPAAPAPAAPPESMGEHTVPLGVASAIPLTLRRVERKTRHGKAYSATVGRLAQDGPEVDVRWHFPAKAWTLAEVKQQVGRRVVVASKALTKRAREALTEAAELISAALGQDEMKQLRVSRALLSQATIKITEVVGTTDDTADEQRHEPNPEAGPEANPGIDAQPNPGVRDPERAAAELLAKLMAGDYPAWETMQALRDEVERHIDRMDEAALVEMAN